jgi:hypothetical protein
MKHITPDFKPIKIQPKLNIHGKPLKPKTFVDIKITWTKDRKTPPDSQTKRNYRK